MPLLSMPNANNGDVRTKTASTKMTKDELAAFEKFAEERDKSCGELIRELIFREMNTEKKLRSDDTVLQEIVGVQLLLMNALKPMAMGERLEPEAFDRIVTEVHRVKKSVARRIVHEGD